jgi:hypothetical protein
MPNVLSNQFEPDVPLGAPAYSAGPLSTKITPTPATPPAITTPSLADRARANMQRAFAGIASLLGRPATPDAAPANRTAQLESGLDALQKRSTPNILTTVPQMVTVPPPAPTPPPRGQPPQFAFNTWMTAQNSKP